MVHHHHSPGVGYLPSLVGRPALVDAPVCGRDVGDVEDGGPRQVPVLQHPVVAGVGQQSPSQPPLDQTGRLRGEAAGETDVVSTRI